MSTENNRDRERMGVFTQSRSEDIDRRIAETRKRLEYSRRFLEAFPTLKALAQADEQHVLRLW